WGLATFRQWGLGQRPKVLKLGPGDLSPVGFGATPQGLIPRSFIAAIPTAHKNARLAEGEPGIYGAGGAGT
ncbi:MAG TPA: hypothetical protein PKD17_11030, partial [Cellvibrionaceae bacterium]|nr:hypothetical protein [Cellvibrionaceae bacterium]